MFNYSYIYILICTSVLMTSQASATDIDPTKPFGHSALSSSTTPEGQQMVLESIIHGDGIHTVVISGKVLKTFDYIGEYQLTAVNDQSVILRSKTERLKLPIFKSNVVKIKVTKTSVTKLNKSE